MDFFNYYVNYTPKQIEQFKLELLFGDNDPTKIFTKIGYENINGLFNTFQNLYKTYDNCFLNYKEKINFENIDIHKLPIFKKTLDDTTNTWSIKYCDSSEINQSLTMEITYGELKKDIANIKKYVTGDYSITRDSKNNCKGQVLFH